MEQERRERPHIEVHGNYIDIHDNTFIGGTHYFTDPQAEHGKAQHAELSDDCIKHAIDQLMMANSKQNKRWWFIPYRVMKDAGKVVDLNGFEAYINRLYQNKLPLPIDIHDLSKEVDVLSFSKPFEEWTPTNAPFSGKTYEIYKELIVQFKAFLT